MNLYINACARNDSRTNALAKYLIEKLKYDFEEVKLFDKSISPLDLEKLELRDELIRKKEYLNPIFDLANQFANAQNIIISAPYWDLSFPSILKTYIENINVLGITFSYSNEGIPQGLCKAKNLYYITTSGGPIVNDEFGYGYIKALCNIFYGIKNAHYIKAQGLDIYGADIESILNQTKKEIDKI